MGQFSLNGFWLLGLGIPSLLGSDANDVKVPKPTEAQLVQFLGQKMPSGFSSVTWKADEPSQTNLMVYAVEPPKYDAAYLQGLARTLGVSGEPQRLPSDFLGAPGYWIKEPNPTNRLTWKSAYVSLLSGAVGFGSGEDTHKWDLKGHRPLVSGIPTAAEALAKTLALLPVLGISKEDLEHNPDGTLRWTGDTDGTSYMESGERKRYVRQINVNLWQRLPKGGSVLSVGGGGMLKAGFMHEGKLSELKLLFRGLKPVTTVGPRSREQVITMLRNGEGRTFRESLPDSITVTNCAVMYPQGNMTCRQDYVWPFYAVTGVAVVNDETNVVNVYVAPVW